MRKWLLRLFGLLLVAAIGFAGWTMLNPNQDVEGRAMGTVSIDFKTLKLKARRNKYLVLPEGFRGAETPDAVSPGFKMSAAALANRAKDLWLKQERTQLVRDIDAALQFELVQRSAIFRFPDYIVVQAVDLGDGRAALAVYSRSRYGRSDFGVNRKRMRVWLALLKKELPN